MPSKILLFFICVFFTLTSFHEGVSEEENYINSYSYIAVEEMYRSKIPASVILAQGMIESNCGRSTLATQAKNHFGIKCKSGWSRATFFKFDDDRNARGEMIKSCFRVYNSSAESYSDHSNFLMQSDRYAGLFAFESNDYEGWANGLQLCGYATDQKYAEKIIQLIERYSLSAYDVLLD